MRLFGSRVNGGGLTHAGESPARDGGFAVSAHRRLVALVGSVPASATPTLGASGAAFYTPPSPLPAGAPATSSPTDRPRSPSAPGRRASTPRDLLYYRPTRRCARPRHRHGDRADGGMDRMGTRPVIDTPSARRGSRSRARPRRGSPPAPSTRRRASWRCSRGRAVVLTYYQGYTTVSQTLYGRRGRGLRRRGHGGRPGARQVPGPTLQRRIRGLLARRSGGRLGGPAAAVLMTRRSTS